MIKFRLLTFFVFILVFYFLAESYVNFLDESQEKELCSHFNHFNLTSDLKLTSM